jgi:hypothetical protein
MRTCLTTLLVLVLVLAAFSLAPAADPKDSPPNTLTDQEKKDGWKLLFDGKSLDQWRVFKKPDAKGWTVKDGAIYLEKTGSGDLMTKEKFANFEFSIDFQFESGNNSGIIYRVTEEVSPSYNSGPEMQVAVHPPGGKLGKNAGGSLYDMYAPTANPFRPNEQWNRFKIVANGKHLEQWVNDVKVVDCDIGSADWNEKLASSKWKTQKLFASQSAGHIALQDHGSKIMFRNVKVRVLPETK